MTDRKPRPLWPFVTATLIVAPVLYVLSFGPACLLAERDIAPRPLAFIYGPILDQFGEGEFGKWVEWYGAQWSRKGSLTLLFYDLVGRLSSSPLLPTGG